MLCCRILTLVNVSSFEHKTSLFIGEMRRVPYGILRFFGKDNIFSLIGQIFDSFDYVKKIIYS